MTTTDDDSLLFDLEPGAHQRPRRPRRPRPEAAPAAPADDGQAALPAPRRVSAVEIASALGRPAPTPEQVAVIEAPPAPLLVVAGAGSGKTETMAARVVWLVTNGVVNPEQVLGLTFTRKAAGELSERIRARLRSLAGRGLLPEPQPVTVSTYHAYAASLLADHGLRLGVEPGAGLLGEAGAWQLVDELVAAWDGDMSDVESARSTVTKAVLGLAGEAAEHLADLDDVDALLAAMAQRLAHLPASVGDSVPGRPNADIRKLVRELRARRRLLPLVEAYARRKRELAVVDFGDQLAAAAALARDVPEVAAAERLRYPVVLLDEYQDTSHSQLVLLRALFGDGHAVTAVGDPHQSIYGWRGASAGNLERFPRDFPAGEQPAAVLRLSTSWRNDAAILDAANALAEPLRRRPSWLPEAAAPVVGELRARPEAGPGEVGLGWFATLEEEAEAVAEFAARAWDAPAESAQGRPSVAVLCRARAQFPALEAALRGRGLPVEVVGLGGLLHVPEVSDIRAALEVVADPCRNDSLMRLLTGAAWRLGPPDLLALGAWAAEQARRRTARPEPGAGSSVPGAGSSVPGALPASSVPGAQPARRPRPGAPAEGEETTLAEGLEELPTTSWTGPQGEAFTAEGLRRLRRLGDVLRRLRAAARLPLPDLVTEAERALLLDIEVAARPGASPASARAHLDAFVDVAASFADGPRAGTLQSFLGWLSAAEDQERGLDTGVVEQRRDAVQLLTVHASKGLEWDVVAVPGLVEGAFPAGRGEQRKGWLAELGRLPYALRGDRAGLPALRWEAPGSLRELGRELERFGADCEAHALAEERRLAYVAVTRARRSALLTGAEWAEAKGAKRPSLFLLELAELARSGVAGLAVSSWVDPSPAGAANPREARTRTVVWPQDPLGTSRAAVEAGAALVREARAASAAGAGWRARRRARAPMGEEEAAWAEEIDVLLAERDAQRPGVLAVPLPPAVSVSRLVALAEDAPALAARLRRPLPEPPNPHARRGSAFHAWLERRFGAASLVEVSDLPGAADDAAGDDDLAALQERFLASPWASRVPDAVEVSVETPLGPLVVRGRIDAVFSEGGLGGVPRSWDLVDWKTGPPPAPDRAEARAVQLAVYRLAWSRLQQVPLDRVRAAFFYAGTGRTVRPVDLLDEAGLVELVTRAAPAVPGPA